MLIKKKKVIIKLFIKIFSMGTSKSKSQGSILVHPFVENPSLSNINSNSDTLLDHMRDILQTEHSNFVLKDV